MRHLRWLLVLIALMSAFAPMSVLAAPLPPEADAWVQSANPDLPSNTTQLNWENLWARSALAACNADRITLLRWNLTALPTGQTLDTATLRIQANFVSGSTGSGVNAALALFKVANDTWTQDVTWNTMVNGGIFNPTPPIPETDLIQELPLPAPFTTGFYQFTFQSEALRQYVQETLAVEADKKVSFALLVRGACGIGSVGVRLDSSHFGAPTGGASANASPLAGVPPSLELAGPTAVALATLEAQQPAANWPLLIALGALLLMAVAAGLIYRRQAATR
jgi:hypothetical protein